MNIQQQAAAQDESLEVCIAAAPGSGKSTTLIGAVEYEIQRTGKSHHIALITFTNAGADVMKARLKQPVGFVGTLHSYMLGLLRQRDPSLEVIQLEEADKIMEDVAQSLRYKGSKSALVEARQNFWNKPMTLGRHSDAERVMLHYAQTLSAQHKAEFDLILARGLRDIALHPLRPMKFYVDEFQDSSPLDMAIYQKHPKTGLFVVGDHNQAIFSFRGSDPQIFADFFNRPSVSRHILDLNYRSTIQICEAANKLIAYNNPPIKMEMKSANNANGPHLHSYLLPDAYQHDMKVEELVRTHASEWEDMAVLCRTNAQANELKAFIQNRGIDLERNKVFIGTIHSSKGREFHRVAIACADETEDEWQKITDEDRRLFYVAITRAKYAVHAVSAARRHVEWKGWQDRRPTKFINEAGFLFTTYEAGTPTGN